MSVIITEIRFRLLPRAEKLCFFEAMGR